MNTNRHFEDDDLLLYVMRQLPEPEHAAVKQWLAEDAQARRRLVAVQAAVGAFAEVAVPETAVPEGSLERLMGKLGRQEERSAPIVFPGESGFGSSNLAAGNPVRERGAWAPWLSWSGWALAALLLLLLGVVGQRWYQAHGTLTNQEDQVASLSTDAAELRRERDALQADLARREAALTALRAEASNAQAGVSQLQGKLRGESATARQAAAFANEATAAATAATAAADEQAAAARQLAARADAAEREQNRLQSTVAAQTEQLARLSATARDLEAFSALTDPSALRVVLSRPKAQPEPTGRAAYVASNGSLVFLGTNLAPLAPTKAYELWLLPADGSNPVPAGTFVPDAKGNAHLAYPHFPRAVAAKGFAVTVENSAGALVPTMPLVLAGTS